MTEIPRRPSKLIIDVSLNRIDCMAALLVLAIAAIPWPQS